MNCHICGKNAPLVLAIVEAVELEVCSECSKFGKVIHRPAPAQLQKLKPVPRPKQDLPEEVIVADYAERIRKRREQLGLTQEQFARKLAERESAIQKIEAGTIEPSIPTARKIEQHLHIVLVEEPEPAMFIPAKKDTSSAMTLGDLIKKKEA